MIINNIIFNTDLQDILSELVLQLRANGIDYLQKTKDTANSIQVCCPYHANGLERRPSAGIRKSDGMFHCFACNEIHSLQEVISYCFGRTDDMIGAFGWQWLLKNFKTVSIEERKGINLSFTRDIMSKSTIEFVSEKELDTYRYFHPYMYKRKLTDDIIELFDIGFDKDTNCITFPVRDIDGACLFIARRSVKGKYFNYPVGTYKPVYGLYEIRKLNETPTEIIICESMLDALTCWVYGKYAVALNGLGTYNQFKQLSNLSVRKFILATDNDAAGLKARERIRENIKNKIITEYILPKGKKDINELTKEEFENLEEVL